ncbi:hypothetical protein PHMEG_000805 [Phytophthora megakarya]|uniref:Uncharacterized protein n=1 Tax=Phytophthora megakarya TaxID=4795 RepID=A0A225X357_9STRA|nr:hypothetical protein PHMEG_000805 [Phytophthora megakarya]
MCRYPSKKCFHLRAVKRNGERHNLCDFHRQKANKNQRRLELKRKARAATDEPGKRLRSKKPRQRARRAPLSAHLAMKEEKQQEMRNNSGLSSWLLQDLVLLDGVFPVKEELVSPAPVMPPVEVQRLSDVDEDALDRILQGDVKTLDTTSGLEALAALPEGKTSPVDVGESWDHLDLGDYWLNSMPEQHVLSFDTSALGDEDVFVADV